MEDNQRKPFVAAFLSLIAPGLGQIYNEQHKRGLILYGISLIILLSFSLAGLSFRGLLIIVSLLLCWLLYVVIDAAVSAVRLKNSPRETYRKWYYHLIFFSLFFSIGLFAVNYLLGIKAYSIPAGSMQQTLLVGDHLFANNFAYGLRNPVSNKVLISGGKPERGDLVIFIFPLDHRQDYVKRVIGLAGDKVEIIDKQVFVNDKQIVTKQAIYTEFAILREPGMVRDNFGPVTVPANSYFVLGDNRDHSYDSRFWGFVPFDLLRGKALYIYFSLDPKTPRIRWERIGMTIN